MDFEWDIDVLDFQSEVFFLRSIWRNERLLCEVIMKGSKEECRGLKTYVSLLDAKSEQVMVTTIFPPRPLDVKNEEGFGFSDSKQALSEAWESEAGGEDCDKFRVEITNP